MKYYERLKERFETKTAKVGVIGLGYVGLPLAMEMVHAGFTVYGIDVDETKINKLQQGVSYIQDVPQEQVEEAVSAKKFHPTTDYKNLQNLDAISICVPTPLNKNQEPDISYIVSTVEEIKENICGPMLITLESTTYPGTTEELIQFELEKLGLQVGDDFFLCFSPERVDPGNKQFNTYNTPKVIGGTTEYCKELGRLLYSYTVQTVIVVGSTKEAEMTKLIENTFRSINIAFINEVAMMCEKMGMNVWEVIRAASTKPFGFMEFHPGPGIGGHCIPLDPMYLSWKAKEYRFFSKFIDMAQSVNSNMPDHVVAKTSEILNKEAKSIMGAKILILGMAYKPNVDDLRESPGLTVYELYKQSGAHVDYYDPFAVSFRDAQGETIHSIAYDLELFKTYDCAVLITNHKAFDYEKLADLGIPIFDTRNAFQGIDRSNITRLGAPISPVQVKEPALKA